MGLFDKLFDKSKKAASDNNEEKKTQAQKPIKGLARSVQDVLDFEGVTQGGIFIGKGGEFPS